MTNKERPIIFSAPMVRAILEGKKTQTRRVVKWGRVHMPGISADMCSADGYQAMGAAGPYTAPWSPESLAFLSCPYGVPGDRLWVRENFAAPKRYDHLSPRALQQTEILPQLTYFAIPGEDRVAGVGKTRSCLFMPRLASRTTLEVVGVRVERLQGITQDDAKVEGATFTDNGVTTAAAAIGETVDEAWKWGQANPGWSHQGETSPLRCLTSPRSSFGRLWDSINGEHGPHSWDANPWVWVVEFRKVQP